MNPISALIMGAIGGCVGGLLTLHITQNSVANMWHTSDVAYIDDIELQ